MKLSQVLLVILVVSHLPDVLSAPLKHRKPGEPVVREKNKDNPQTPSQQNKKRKEPWWKNPCAVPGGGDRESPTSEGPQDIPSHDPESPGRWVILLNKAIDKVSKIENVFREVKGHLGSDNFNHTWLPEPPSKYLETQPVLHPLRTMTELYKGLQRFAVTLECLIQEKGCKIKKKRVRKSTHQDSAARTELLKEVKSELRMLLCEVQMLLRGLRKLPKHPSFDIINPDQWDVKQGETEKIAQGWAILSRYRKYLLDWEQIAKNLVFSVPKPEQKGPKERRKKGEIPSVNQQVPKSKKGTKVDNSEVKETPAPKLNKGGNKRRQHRRKPAAPVQSPS